MGTAPPALPHLIDCEAVGFGNIKLVGIEDLALEVSGVIAEVGHSVAAAGGALGGWAARRRTPRQWQLPFAPYLALRWRVF